MVSNASTDAEVIAASLTNASEFETLFDRHFRTINRYLRRRLSAPVADDVTADVFTAAFARREAYDLRRPDALPWLFGIAANQMRRYNREERQELRAISGSQQHLPIVMEEPVDEVLRGVIEPALADALAALETRDREVLLLFAWADLGYDEIARALELPVGTVKSRLNRARRVLRMALGGHATSEVLNG
jgi:RNA polymerase sigma-70 factor (ECF subfamily)